MFLKTTHWLSACQGMKINTCSMFFLALLSLCAEECPKHTTHCKQTLIIMEWHSFILLNSLRYREIFQYSLKSRSKWGFPELFQLSKNIYNPFPDPIYKYTYTQKHTHKLTQLLTYRSTDYLTGILKLKWYPIWPSNFKLKMPTFVLRQTSPQFTYDSSKLTVFWL